MKRGGTVRPLAGQSSADGFTIVETLIVLAVTAVLLVSTMLFVSGRQRKTEFAVGIRQLQQDVQRSINEAASGYNGSRFTCSVVSGKPNIAVGTEAVAGTNNDCIFIGTLYVVEASGNLGINGQYIATYPLAAVRKYDTLLSGGETNADIVKKAWPTTNASALVKIKPTNGLTMTGAAIDGGSLATARVGFMVIYDIGQKEVSSQSMAMYQATVSTAGPAGLDYYITNFNGQRLVAFGRPFQLLRAEKVNMCFTDGEQSGLVTIGSNGGVNVGLEIKGNNTCA
jgi:type II secretory pathway pseudopilin PulG